MAARAEALVAPLGGTEIVDFDERNLLDGLHHELRDPFAADDLEGGFGIGVDQTHLEFAAISRIDEARRVEAGHAMLESKTGSGLYESRVSIGQGNGDSGANKSSSTGRRQRDVLAGNEVDARIAISGVGREGEIRIEAEDRKIDHAAEGSQQATSTERSAV